MSKNIAPKVLFFLTVLLVDQRAFASMVQFDFDQIHSQSTKGVKASDIEVYMEGLFGSDISVSQNTTAIKSIGSTSLNFLHTPSQSLGDNSYLKVGKGKGPSGITFDFGANPIHSFNVDFLMLKRAKSLTILADGVVINQQTLTKAQRKTGLTGHQSDYFFDTPVQKLEFIGLKKTSFAIDNLIINIPLPTDEELDDLDNLNEESESDPNENGSNTSETNPPGGAGPGDATIIINQAVAAVPEPSSLLMLAMGLCGAWFSRRVLAL